MCKVWYSRYVQRNTWCQSAGWEGICQMRRTPSWQVVAMSGVVSADVGKAKQVTALVWLVTTGTSLPPSMSTYLLSIATYLNI